MRMSEQINELATALAKAQAEMGPAIFDKVNPHFKNKYASLQSFITACKGPLNKHGLSFIQTSAIQEKGIVLITVLMHSSGQWISGEMLIPQEKPGVQAFGSSTTYIKRYALSAMIGISADDDDDGEEATPAPQQYQKKPTNGNHPPVEKVTEEEAKELGNLLKTVSKKLKADIETFLSDQKLDDYKTVPKAIFLKLRERMMKELNLVKDEEAPF